MDNGAMHMSSCSSSSLGSSTSSQSSSRGANNPSTFEKDVNTIQVPPHTSRKKKPSTKSSSVHPEKSYEKSSNRVLVNTDIEGDIEEGRQPVDSGSLQGQVSHRRSKLVLWSILTCNVLVIISATIAAIVKGLQARTIVSMEDYDSTVTLNTQTTSTSATFDSKITSTMETKTATFVAPPITDNCEGAIFFPLDDLPSMKVGSTLSATPEEYNPFYESCGVSPRAKGVWFTFRSGNGMPIVIYSHIVHTSGLGEKAQISLFGGASCNTLICDTDLGSSDLIRFVPQPKKQYWLLLTGKTSSVAGDYELWIDQEHETKDDPILIRPTLSSAAEFALYGKKYSTSPTTTEPKQSKLTEYEDHKG